MTLPPLPDLKPCPFCGSAPGTLARPDNIDGTEFYAAVFCHCEGYSATAHAGRSGKTLDEARTAAHAAWNRRAALAAVPARTLIRTLSPEQIERHTLTASECPPDSAVMLVSSINRLLSKRPGDAARFAQPVAWLCSLMMEDGTTRTQIVEQDPAGLRWNDDGESSPYKVQPLYAAPQAVPTDKDSLMVAQAVPVPEWQPIETAPDDMFPYLFRVNGIAAQKGEKL